MKRWGWIVFLGAMAAVFLEMRFRQASHQELWWHGFPGFDLGYGFVGAVALALLAKWAGHRWLERSEDYYRDGSR